MLLLPVLDSSLARAWLYDNRILFIIVCIRSPCRLTPHLTLAPVANDSGFIFFVFFFNHQILEFSSCSFGIF